MWWLVAIVALILGAITSIALRDDNPFEIATIVVVLIGIGYFVAHYYLPSLV